MGNSVSIDIITAGNERIPICNHYKCATNAQMRFLILNGKAGFWIKEAMRDMKIKERADKLKDRVDDFIAINLRRKTNKGYRVTDSQS